jgi:hypothetical protein
MGAAEAALRLMVRRGRGDWMTLVVEPGNAALAAAEELAEEMESLGDVPVERIRGAEGALDLAERLAPLQAPVVVAGLDSWPASEWSHLDELRSRFERDERTALVVSSKTFENIMREAPNFSSWLGASVWTYQPRASELTEAERERRLDALRAWSNLSDKDVIARAERGTLPSDPEYAEWLVLLDRGDLLDR